MSKRLLLVLVGCLWASSSYSETTPYFGTTGNAAVNGLNWSMNDVLPTPPGLDINGVIYSYTPQKNTADDMKVHVQNENANGNGYIFRETDDWSGAQGGIEIRKIVPVIPNLPRELWGDGSIEVEGTGTVEDASVVYSYKVDPCYDPQFDPSCPGYEPVIPDIETVNIDDLYDATQDEYVLNATEETDKDIYEEEEVVENEEDEEERKIRLEAALAAVDNSAMFAEAFAQAQILAAMNMAVQMSSYYASNIPGGQYKETIVLVDKKIEDNKKGLRNGLAQQILHEEMVSMQYNN